MAGEMVRLNTPCASVGGMSAATAANTACTVLLTAPTTPERWAINSVQWSLSADASSATPALTATDGTITVNLGYCVKAGPGFLSINPAVAFPPGNAVTVSLAAAGSGVSATLNVGAFKVGVQ